MIAGLARFVAALRREGVDASPAELLDASRAVERVGVEDRSSFRAALRATLAKGRRQQEVFDRVFERYFAAPARGRGKRRGQPAGGAGERRAGGPGAASGTGRRTPPRQHPPSPGSAAASREADARATVRSMVERARESRRNRPGRLRRVVLDPAPEAPASLRPPAVPGAPEVAGNAEARDLTAVLTEAEERELARQVPRIVERLRVGHGRRRRRARAGRLSLRDVFRHNVSRGGVPFELPRHRPRPRRPRVVLLVDVSHSVARAAGYFLWLAGSFLTLDRRTRVLAFVDRPVDVTGEVSRWLRRGAGIRPGASSFLELLAGLSGLDLQAPSDYGTALHRLLVSPHRPAGRDTILVVLGDGRTNRFDPLPWVLEDLAGRSRAVLWLVPEPRARWGTGDSAMERYLPAIDTAVEAWNLAGLARGVAELLRELG